MDTQSSSQLFIDTQVENQDLKILVLKLNQDKIMYEKKVQRRNTEIYQLKQIILEKEKQIVRHDTKPIATFNSSRHLSFDSKFKDDQDKLEQLEKMILQHKKYFESNGVIQVEQLLSMIIERALKYTNDNQYETQLQQYKLNFLQYKIKEYEKTVEEIHLNSIKNDSIREQILQQYLQLKLKYKQSQKDLMQQKKTNYQDDDLNENLDKKYQINDNQSKEVDAAKKKQTQSKIIII